MAEVKCDQYHKVYLHLKLLCHKQLKLLTTKSAVSDIFLVTRTLRDI